MDRNEIALKFAVALAGGDAANARKDSDCMGATGVATDAFILADAFLAACKPATVEAKASEPAAPVDATDPVYDECVAYLKSRGFAVTGGALAAWHEATRRARSAAPAAPAPSPDSLYVPQVGDVVRVTRPPMGEEWPCFLDDEWVDDHRPEGRVVETTTAHAAAAKVSIVRVGADRPPHGVDARRLALVRPAASPPAVDREGLALRARVAEAVFNAFDPKKSDSERAHAVYLAALEAVGYDKSWASRSVGSFIEHLKGGAS